MWPAEHICHIVFADSVAQYDEYLIVADYVPGKLNGVTNTLAFILIYKMRV